MTSGEKNPLTKIQKIIASVRVKLKPALDRARQSVASSVGTVKKTTMRGVGPTWDRLKPHAANAWGKVQTKVPAIGSVSNSVSNTMTSIENPWKAIFGKIQTLHERGFDFYGKIFTVIACAYFLADVVAFSLSGFIPNPGTTPRNFSSLGQLGVRPIQLSDYDAIISRNLFNSSGFIPGEKAANPDQGPALRSTLPLTLIGTVILRTSQNSLATIEDKSASLVFPVREEDEIPGKLKVLKVEARKVTFINLASGRKEYIDLPEEPNAIQTTIRTSSIPSRSVKKDGIEKVSETQLNVDSVAIDSAMKDFNGLMTQARALPYFENGQPAGYKIVQIVKGSFFDKIGIQNDDVIKAADGEPIRDPGQAFNMMNQLKTANHLELTVLRGGVEKTITYNIKR